MAHKYFLSFLRNALLLSLRKGDQAEEGKAYGNLGRVYFSPGHFRKAIKYYEKHLKIAKQSR